MSYEVKYAPKTLDDVVISDPNIYKVLNEYIKYGNKKPLLIYGSYGLGKSSVARLLPSLIEGEPTPKMDIHNLDFTSVNAIRSYFNIYTQNAFGKLYKVPLYFVVDESKFKDNVANTLRTITDELQGNIQFIFTMNDPNVLDDGLLDRFKHLHFTPTKAADWLERIKFIVQSEGVTTLSDATLLRFINNQLNQCSSHRKLLEALQTFVSAVKSQTIALPASSVVSLATPTKAPAVLKSVPPTAI